MKLFYSAEAGGFFSSQISGNNVPSDVVEITSAEHLTLLNGLREGRLISIDEEGRPSLGDLPIPVDRDVSKEERDWRDQAMVVAIGMRDCHRDQLEIEVDTTLSSDQFKELLIYMQALRDWPQTDEFPNSEHRPKAPVWIAEAAQQ